MEGLLVTFETMEHYCIFFVDDGRMHGVVGCFSFQRRNDCSWAADAVLICCFQNLKGQLLVDAIKPGGACDVRFLCTFLYWMLPHLAHTCIHLSDFQHVRKCICSNCSPHTQHDQSEALNISRDIICSLCVRVRVRARTCMCMHVCVPNFLLFLPACMHACIFPLTLCVCVTRRAWTLPEEILCFQQTALISINLEILKAQTNSNLAQTWSAGWWALWCV